MSWVEKFNALVQGQFPGFLGMRFREASPQRMVLEMPVRPEFSAPNGYLHAGAIVSLADTACGFGCRLNLPEGSRGFTTIELKSNHLGTAHDGVLVCTATPVHVGRSTHVWDAMVEHEPSHRRLVIFRCTQLILSGEGADARWSASRFG